MTESDRRWASREASGDELCAHCGQGKREHGGDFNMGACPGQSGLQAKRFSLPNETHMSGDDSMRGCTCDDCEKNRAYARKYQADRMARIGLTSETANISREPVGGACQNQDCKQTEAECARNGNRCCRMCTHTFDGGATSRKICECGQVVELRRGRQRKHSCMGQARNGVPVAV